jgi:predicted CopG family antitoxin
MTTFIQISDEQWKILNDMKLKGESFADVLNKLLKTSQRSSLGSIKNEVTRK